MTTGDSIEEIREEHARAEVHNRAKQDEGLLLTLEELKHAHFEGIYDYPDGEINEITYSPEDAKADERVAKAQLAKAKPIIEKQEREKLLAIIRDWDVMTEEEGGEEKWQKKYGLPTADLVQVLEQALKGG